MLTCSVPSRASRAGHALRAIPLAHGGRPARDHLGEARLRRRTATARREPRQTAVPLLTSTTWSAGRRQRGDVRRRDHRLPELAHRLRQDAAAACVELREHVVEQEQRRGGEGASPPRAGGTAPRAAARPATRSRAALGRRRSARSSRCGPSPVVPRARSVSSRASSASATAARPRRRASRRAGRSPRGAAGSPARARPSFRAALPPGGRRAPQGARSRARPRRAATIPSCARRSAAFRCASAAAYSCGSPARAGKRRASTLSTYARRTAGPPLTTARRSGVNTSVGNSRRRDSADGSREPSSSALFPAGGASFTLTSCGTPRAIETQADQGAGLAGADHAAVAARAWREALGAEVDRLEQVRLAGAVLARHEHEARGEAQL